MNVAVDLMVIDAQNMRAVRKFTPSALCGSPYLFDIRSFFVMETVKKKAAKVNCPLRPRIVIRIYFTTL